MWNYLISLSFILLNQCLQKRSSIVYLYFTLKVLKTTKTLLKKVFENLATFDNFLVRQFSLEVEVELAQMCERPRLTIIYAYVLQELSAIIIRPTILTEISSSVLLQKIRFKNEMIDDVKIIAMLIPLIWII